MIFDIDLKKNNNKTTLKVACKMYMCVSVFRVGVSLNIHSFIHSCM